MTHRYERRLPGIGPVRRTTGLTEPHEIAAFDALMLDLARRRPELAVMFRDKQIDAFQLLRANAEERLSGLIPDARTLAPLWTAIAAAWTRHKTGGATVVRYQTAVRKAQRLAVLPPDARVSDLVSVDWDSVAAAWGGSSSDWMAFYRMMSTFLTLHFGGKRTGVAHPFRHRVMDLLPRQREVSRVPNLSILRFQQLVALTPEHVRPSFVTLAGLGLRVGEYLRLERGHLRPETMELLIPGTKTEGSAAVLPVAPELWPWVEAAVPSPVQYGWLRRYWVRACRELGLSAPGRYTGPRLHDIRHCTGQWATEAGANEASVQQYLRHRDPKTTRIYTVQQLRADVSTVVSTALLGKGI